MVDVNGIVLAAILFSYTIWVLFLTLLLFKNAKNNSKQYESLSDKFLILSDRLSHLTAYEKKITPLLEEINNQLDNVNRLEGCVIVDKDYVHSDKTKEPQETKDFVYKTIKHSFNLKFTDAEIKELVLSTNCDGWTPIPDSFKVISNNHLKVGSIKVYKSKEVK